jgi:uncharacterized protein YdgA (DUF945 family)
MEGVALALALVALAIALTAAWYTHEERARQAKKERAAKLAKKRRNRWLF